MAGCALPGAAQKDAAPKTVLNVAPTYIAIAGTSEAHDLAAWRVVLDDEDGLSGSAHQTGTSMNVEMRFTKLATSIGLVI